MKLLFLIPDRLSPHDPYIDGAKGILVDIPFQTMIRERFISDPDPFFRDGIVDRLDRAEIEVILTLEWLIQPEVYHFCTHTLLQNYENFFRLPRKIPKISRFPAHPIPQPHV